MRWSHGLASDGAASPFWQKVLTGITAMISGAGEKGPRWLRVASYAGMMTREGSMAPRKAASAFWRNEPSGITEIISTTSSEEHHADQSATGSVATISMPNPAKP